MKQLLVKSLLLMFIAVGLQNCSDDKAASRSMEQIYKEEGVPVKVKTIKNEKFATNFTYNTILSGIKESSASAMVGGRIEKVLVKVGDFVEKDQVIVTFPTDNPASQYFQAKVAYENAKSTYERYKALFQTGGISAMDLDNIETQYEVSKANWNSMKKTVKVLAPISGYVTKVSVKESDNVRSETLLVTIADLSKLKASLKISENEIDDIKVGTKAVAQWQGKSIEGTITQVDMAMNRATQAFNADVIFNNQNTKFKAGITAEVLIAGAAKENAITIERKNLVKRGGEFFAYVNNNSTAKERKVKLGKNRGLFVEIIDGLKENDQLITEGQMFLENDTKVKIISGENK